MLLMLEPGTLLQFFLFCQQRLQPSIRLPLLLTFAMPTKKGAHCGDACSIAASLAAWHLCTICLLRLLLQMQQDIHV
jgi:hypothetical protein